MPRDPVLSETQHTQLFVCPLAMRWGPWLGETLPHFEGFAPSLAPSPPSSPSL